MVWHHICTENVEIDAFKVSRPGIINFNSFLALIRIMAVALLLHSQYINTESMEKKEYQWYFIQQTVGMAPNILI